MELAYGMRTRAKLAAVLLTLGMSAITLRAQEPRTNHGGGHVAAHPAARTNATPAAPSAKPQTFHRSLGGQATTVPYQNPFNHQIHLPGGGGGCYSCGYSYYGGYGYGGYGYGYGGGYVGELTNPAGPTATDRVLANGGTFNSINDSTESQSAAPPQQQQPIYIRPEYSTQYSDNSTINTPLVNDQASATSDSPAILKFKDGTEMTIHNYAVFGANIVVLTPERHKYPISSIDVAATQKANDAAGYELHLPAVFTSH